MRRAISDSAMRAIVIVLRDPTSDRVRHPKRYGVPDNESVGICKEWDKNVGTPNNLTICQDTNFDLIHAFNWIGLEWVLLLYGANRLARLRMNNEDSIVIVP